MKKSILSICYIWIFNVAIAQHNVYIQAGTNIRTSNNATLVLDNCNLVNASINASFSSCLLTELGNVSSTIGGSAGLDFKEITINKPSSVLKMTGELLIQDKLNFQTGHLDLNGNILSLAPLALFLGEKSSSRLIGENGGYATINVIMNNPNLQNPGNLGLSVTSAANMGTVSIFRGHQIQSQGGSPFSIKRHYAIESSNGSNFLGNLRFAYFDEELNGIDEDFTQIWSSDNGTNWTNRGFTNKNTVLNYIESLDLTTLEKFTLSNPTPGIAEDPVMDFRIQNKKATSSQFSVEASILPNPVSNHEDVFLELQVSKESKAIIQIINQLGQGICFNQITALPGIQKIPLQITDLPKGIYTVHILFENESNKSLKLLIQ